MAPVCSDVGVIGQLPDAGKALNLRHFWIGARKVGHPDLAGIIEDNKHKHAPGRIDQADRLGALEPLPTSAAILATGASVAASNTRTPPGS